MTCRLWLHRGARCCAPFLSPPPSRLLSFPILRFTSALPGIQSSLAIFPRLSHLYDPNGPLKGSSKLRFSSCSGITAAISKQNPVFCSSRKTCMQASADISDNEPQAFEITGSAGRRFAVLVTGHASEYTEKTYGGYGNMLARLLQDPGEVWDVFPVVEGKFPMEEELGKYEGFVLTGSAHDAHANEGWILQLCSVLQSLHDMRKKMLGVCFGHQVLSRALGGKTGRSDVGWEIGLKDVTLTDAISSKTYGFGLPRILKVLQSHRDQVLELPPGGELLGSSEKTGIEVFAVGDNVLGIQGHPEYTKDVLLDIIDNRCTLGIIKEEEANLAKASMLVYEDDKEILRDLCKAFLKKQHV